MKKTYVMKQIVVLLLIFISIFGCEPKNKEGCHEILRIRNDSDKDLYYTLNYCDSLLPIDNFVGDKLVLLKSKSQKKEYERGGFENDFHYCSYFVILFVDAELREVPYDTIRKYDMVLYRRIYTLEQLDSLDWIVTVP